MSRINGSASIAIAGVLLAGAQPAQEPACLKCHAPIREVLQKKVRHAVVDLGCESCHIDHRNFTGKTASRTEHYLSTPQPDLCLTCHEPKDRATDAAHRGQPWEKSRCTGCHDSHASDAPKMMASQTHGPFGARRCEGCHLAPKDGGVRLVADARELCFRCHDEMKARLAAAPHLHSLLATEPNSCVDCHDPHASNRKYLLKKPVNALCESCHAGVIAGKEFVHKPARVSCVLCHDPHAGNTPKGLHAAGNDLCLECHGTRAIKPFTADAPVVLFNGRASLPAKPFPDLKILDLEPGSERGHPMADHPVMANAEAANGEKPAKEVMTCLTCHRPHAGNGSALLLVTESATTSPLCVKCHR